MTASMGKTGGTPCATHGLAADVDGACAICRTSDRAEARRARSSALVATSFCVALAGIAFWVAHRPALEAKRAAAAERGGASPSLVTPMADDGASARRFDMRTDPGDPEPARAASEPRPVPPPPPPFAADPDDPPLHDDPNDFVVRAAAPRSTLARGAREGAPPPSPSELNIGVRN